MKGRFCKGVLVFKEGLSIDLLAQASCLIQRIKGLETETLGKIELIVFGREFSVADWLVGLQEFIIYSAGPANINSYVSEFVNLSERGMKARGRKIKFYKAAPLWIEENMQQVNYFAYLSKPKQTASKLVASAELNNVEIGIFRY